MPEISATELVEDIDTALRDAYHALRTALNKAEDLKMKMVRQPKANLFGSEHNEIYKMYIGLSNRFQEIREEIDDRSNLVQPKPSSPNPTPRVEEPPATGANSVVQRDESQLYTPVPVRFYVYSASV